MLEKLKEMYYKIKYYKLAKIKREQAKHFTLNDLVLPGRVLSFHLNSAEVLCELDKKFFIFQIHVETPTISTSQTTTLQADQLVFVHFGSSNFNITYNAILQTFDKKLVVPPPTQSVLLPRHTRTHSDSSDEIQSPLSSDFEVV